MTHETPPTSAPDDDASPRLGVRGWVRGLVARANEPDLRQAAAWTLGIVAAVFALGALPLEGGFDVDLRDGDAVGGWNQVTLVGFSVNRPFGRFIPDQPGRSDLRIISNRPLPEHFDLELDAWTLRPGHPVELTVTFDDEAQTQRYPGDKTTRRYRFTNAGRARVLALSLGASDKLAIERIAVIETGATGDTENAR